MAGLINLNWKTVLALTAGGLVVFEYTKGQVGQAAKAAGEAVNPLDRENVFNRSTEALFSEVTDDDRSPGAALHDYLNPGPERNCMTKVQLPNGEYRAAWHQCGQGPDMGAFPPGTKEVG